MRILLIENYNHCGFCNHVSTHFSILGVSANALHDCYLGIVDSFRARSHGGGGPHVGEVTRLGGVTRLSI